MSEPKIRTKQFIFRNSVKWQGQKQGLLTSFGKPDIQIATPPEFKGHPGIWTPEDLLVASVNACIMTTFLYYADKEGVEFLSYQSDAEGILEKVEGQFIFSEIKVRPRLSVSTDRDAERVKDLIGLSEKSCLISNSIRSKVEITLEIELDLNRRN